MSLARCEQIQNDNVSTSTFQINMQLPLILIFEDPEPLHSRSGEEMWNLTFLKNVTNLDTIMKIRIFYGDKKLNRECCSDCLGSTKCLCLRYRLRDVNPLGMA